MIKFERSYYAFLTKMYASTALSTAHTALAAVSRAGRLQAGGAGLPLPQRAGTEQPGRRISTRIRHGIAATSSIGFDGQPRRATIPAFNTGRAAVGLFLWKRLKSGTIFRRTSHLHHHFRHLRAN